MSGCRRPRARSGPRPRRLLAGVLLLPAWLSFWLMPGCSQRMAAPLVAMDGAVPGVEVDRGLDRAITLSSCLQLFPWARAQWQANLELISDLQPALIGRAALVWGWEAIMLRSMSGLARRVEQIHAVAPDAVLQGCIFEFVSPDVERVAVPPHVQRAFGLEPVARNYEYEAMLPQEGPPQQAPGWDDGGAVPDITRLETRLWFYHLATLYLDAGLEAIHLGNIERIVVHDHDLRWTDDLLQRIRAYAAANARRGWVMLDAHTHGLVRDRRLLLDFHSWPLRLRETGPPELEEVVLERGYHDAIYGRSRGGITPDGRLVRHQRFLVEVDSGYAGSTPGGCTRPECVWGSDEITWFARQPAERRDELLRRFWRDVPLIDPVGRFQVPGVRQVQSQLADGCEFYLAHDPEVLPCGGGQRAVIAELWGLVE